VTPYDSTLSMFWYVYFLWESGILRPFEISIFFLNDKMKMKF